MRVHHLDCCTMCPRGRSAWNGEGSFFARATLVSHCLLIETEAHGLVLVDTGIGVGDVRNSRRLGPMFGRAMAIDATRGEMPARSLVVYVRKLSSDGTSTSPGPGCACSPTRRYGVRTTT